MSLPPETPLIPAPAPPKEDPVAVVDDAVWNDSRFWSEAAEHAFARSYRKGRREAWLARLHGRDTTLHSFDEVRERLGLLAPRDTGTRMVSLDEIVGSVGKHRLFTRSFRPASTELKRRWKRAYAVANGIAGFAPIEVYEVAGTFYVVDGHFRTSVAHALDVDAIEAHVWTGGT